MKHYEITGPSAVHPFCFGGSTDPSLDADNEVAPGKAWLDDTDPDAPVLKVRNEADDGWISLGG